MSMSIGSNNSFNRAPNQTLLQRQKVLSSKSLQQKPEKPKMKGPEVQKDRKQDLRNYYNLEIEWTEEVQANTNLVIVEKTYMRRKYVFAKNQNNEWTHHGQSSDYKDIRLIGNKLSELVEDSKIIFKTECDHIIPKKVGRELVGLDDSSARAIAVPARLNQLKENTNKQILARSINEYNNCTLRECLNDFINEIEKNMWNCFYAEKNHPDYNKIISNDLDILALQGYKRHREFAVSQIVFFTDKYQIPDNSEAAKIVYVLMRLIRLLDKIPEEITNALQFDRLGSHFIPSYIIEVTGNIFNKLCQAIKSVQHSLKLSSSQKNDIKNMVDREILHAKANSITMCKRYITKWLEQPTFPKINEVELDRKLELFASNTNIKLLDDLSQIYVDKWFVLLELENLNSTLKFEEFKKSSENYNLGFLFTNFDYDPFVSWHTIVEQQSNSKLLEEKLNELILNRDQIKSELKIFDLSKFINNSDKQFNEIQTHLVLFEKMEKLNPDSEIVNNEFDTLYRQLEILSEGANEILFLTKQCENLETKPFISLPELEARYACIGEVLQSFLALSTYRQEINLEFRKNYESVCQAHIDVLQEAYELCKTSILLAEIGIQDNLLELKKMQQDMQRLLDNLSETLNEVHVMLNEQLITIEEIDAVPYEETDIDDAIATQAENSSVPEIKTEFNTDVKVKVEILDNKEAILE